MRSRLARTAAIDFFGASGRDVAARLIGGLEATLRPAAEQTSGEAPPAEPLSRRVWVTRQGMHVDRIASAWLIRRFLDPQACFRFILPKGYVPQPGELRFDMYEAEFTHRGDRCTFEALLEEMLARGDPPDPALQMIAEIVHDIDFKDGRSGRPETDGIRTMIAAFCAASDADDERLRRGGALLEDLYGHFRRRPG